MTDGECLEGPGVPWARFLPAAPWRATADHAASNRMNGSAAFREEDESMPASLWDVEYLAFDVETTGLSPAFCEIVEFGAVRFTADGTEVGRFQQLVNPGCAIPFHASRVHGITDDMVSGQPRLKTVLPDFLEFLTVVCPAPLR